MTSPDVRRIGDGVYLVGIDERVEVVYVARSAAGGWASCRGEVFREMAPATERARRARRGDAQEALSAPMPATVLRLLVAPGAQVKKGETLVILEAMKMELPLRASVDATVKAVHCRQGDLVQPDTVLVELS